MADVGEQLPALAIDLALVLPRRGQQFGHPVQPLGSVCAAGDAELLEGWRRT